jgi:hypothetical protein
MLGGPTAGHPRGVHSMKRIALACLIALTTGCGTRLVIDLPKLPPVGFREAAPRPQPGCTYLNVVVDYSTNAMGMTAKDVALSAHVAQAMARELTRLGAHVSEDPGSAYWSLMIMATHNIRDGGFIFSAYLTLRNLQEVRDSGLAIYAGSQAADDKQATMYTGVSYGSHQDLDKMAREFVRQADAALLPAARELCAFEALEARRRDEVDEQVPYPELPL